MTANAMKSDREACMKAGMNDYLSKPIDPEELAKVISTQLMNQHIASAQPDEVKPSTKAVVFDRQGFLARIGGDEKVLEKVIDCFILQDVPMQIRALHEAIGKNDSVQARHRAHNLKGAAGTVGAIALQEAAKDLEMSAKEGNLSRAPEQMRLIKESFSILKQIINKPS